MHWQNANDSAQVCVPEQAQSYISWVQADVLDGGACRFFFSYAIFKIHK